MNSVIFANEKDNVVTCVRSLTEGEVVSVNDEKYKVNSEIPIFHKMATVDIAQGEVVHKYGEIIGVATIDIKKGDHVHVHNIESTRGRGDKK